MSNDDFGISIIGCICLNNETYQLGVDKNNNMYKAKKIGETRRDNLNRTTLYSIYGEFEKISKNDF